MSRIKTQWVSFGFRLGSGLGNPELTQSITPKKHSHSHSNTYTKLGIFRVFLALFFAQKDHLQGKVFIGVSQ